MLRQELLARLLLHGASRLVPAPRRADWRAEWAAELWQVAANFRIKQREIGSKAPPSPLAFVSGAIPDALYLRREAATMAADVEERLSNRPEASTTRAKSGPRRSLVPLASLCFFTVVATIALPGSRHALFPYHNPEAADLVLVTHTGFSHLDTPTIRFADYLYWRTSAQKLYRDLAFYQPQQLQLHLASNDETTVSALVASNNLFKLLDLIPQNSVPTRAGQPQLFLSRNFLARAKNGDLHPGKYVEIAGQAVLVAGVLTDSQWQLPGHPDVWLLGDAEGLSEISPSERGFVVAHVRPKAFSSEHRVMIDGDDHYPCLSLAEISHRPDWIFCFALLLALLAVPATLPIFSGAHPSRTRIRVCSWMYFAAKLALILPLAYTASLCAGYGFLALESTAAPCVQITVAFSMLLSLFRWCWQDQRRRCPQCLGRLTHPAHVGLASRSFLAWSGTELVCTSGHGLLHIPELPTSWFSRPRWLQLDSSWKALFIAPMP